MKGHPAAAASQPHASAACQQSQLRAGARSAPARPLTSTPCRRCGGSAAPRSLQPGRRGSGMGWVVVRGGFQATRRTRVRHGGGGAPRCFKRGAASRTLPLTATAAGRGPGRLHSAWLSRLPEDAGRAGELLEQLREGRGHGHAAAEVDVRRGGEWRRAWGPGRRMGRCWAVLRPGAPPAAPGSAIGAIQHLGSAGAVRSRHPEQPLCPVPSSQPLPPFQVNCHRCWQAPSSADAAPELPRRQTRLYRSISRFLDLAGAPEHP